MFFTCHFDVCKYAPFSSYVRNRPGVNKNLLLKETFEDDVKFPQGRSKKSSCSCSGPLTSTERTYQRFLINANL